MANSSKHNGNGAHPGKVLKSLFMDPLGITAYRLSKDIGITPIATSHILRGMRSITPSIAVRLGTYFGVDAEFWLRLQAHHDIAKETRRRKSDPVKTCDALNGRAFVLKESRTAGGKSWQVMMTKGRTSRSAA
jgi:antitoxin HigA-1